MPTVAVTRVEAAAALCGQIIIDATSSRSESFPNDQDCYGAMLRLADALSTLKLECRQEPLCTCSCALYLGY